MLHVKTTYYVLLNLAIMLGCSSQKGQNSQNGRSDEEGLSNSQKAILSELIEQKLTTKDEQGNVTAVKGLNTAQVLQDGQDLKAQDLENSKDAKAFTFEEPSGTEAEFSEPIMVTSANLLLAQASSLEEICKDRSYQKEEPTIAQIMDHSQKHGLCGLLKFDFCIRLAFKNSEKKSYSYMKSPPMQVSFVCPEVAFANLSIAINPSLTEAGKVDWSLDFSPYIVDMYLTNASGCSEGGEWQVAKDKVAVWSVATAVANPETGMEHSAYAKFRDMMGNESSCLSAIIAASKLINASASESTNAENSASPEAPSQLAFSINNSEAYTTTPSVTLNLSALGASKMYVTNTSGCTADGNWEAYATSKTWTLAQTNATATVYVKFRSAPDKESACINASIIHDDQAPSATMSINSGASYINSTTVTINFSQNDASKMYVTNASDCASGGGWENFASVKASWTLANTNAANTVYAKLQDAAGNISGCLSASITHDDTAPSAPASLDDGTNHPISTVTLSWTAGSDSLSGVASYQVALGSSSGASDVLSWTSASNSTNYTLKGLSLTRDTIYYASIRSVDQAGNVSSSRAGDGFTAIHQVTAVAAGDYHSCALLNTGKVKCWGFSTYGQLGQGNTVQTGASNSVTLASLTGVNLGTGRTALKVAATDAHTCAVLDDHTVKCWGYNSTGNLGLGDTTRRGYNPSDMGDSLPAVNLGNGRTAQDIALPLYSSCALLDNGTVKCWGNGGYGALGQGNGAHLGDAANEMGDNLAAINLGASRTATQIAAGERHVCALLDNATIKCWGRNNYGQLGQDNTDDIGDGAGEMAALNAINLGANALQVAAGGYHTCARLTGGVVKCWGYNGYGQLGLDHTNNLGDQTGEMAALTTVNLGQNRTANQIAAGPYHSCAVLDDGSSKCWGYNAFGQLGQGHTSSLGDSSGEIAAITPIDVGSGRTVQTIHTNGRHTCAKLDTNELKCWGFNAFGELGYNKTDSVGDSVGKMGDNLAAVNLGSGRTVSNFGLGTYHSCAVLDNGSLKCWGRNSSGQLGQGNQSQTGSGDGSLLANTAGIDLGSDRTATAIAAGVNSSCALLDNKKVVCWGGQGNGRLGYPATSYIGNHPGEMGNNLVSVPLGSDALSLSTRLRFVCTRLSGGAVKCWGDNTYGQLGQDDTETIGDSSGEVENLSAVNLGSGRSASQISAGNYHACAILDNNTLKCWGRNDYGQLGVDETEHYGDEDGEMGILATVNLGSGRTPQQVAAGNLHTCALLDNQKVKCWGRNNYGQLGQNNTTDYGDANGEMAALAEISLGANATQIAVGNDFSCALLTGGGVKCWGYNASGTLGQEADHSNHLGDGANEMASLQTISLGTGRSATQLAAGADHLCALLEDKSVKCWGNGYYGQLGQQKDHVLGIYAASLGDNLPAISIFP